MPLYEFLCEKCQHEFEEHCRYAAKNAQSCPRCKHSPACPMPSLTLRERHFHGEGTISLMHGFNPEDVPEARRLYPDTTITDQGDVVFDRRSDERRFVRQKREIERVSLQKTDEG